MIKNGEEIQTCELVAIPTFTPSFDSKDFYISNCMYVFLNTDVFLSFSNATYKNVWKLVIICLVCKAKCKTLYVYFLTN